MSANRPGLLRSRTRPWAEQLTASGGLATIFQPPPLPLHFVARPETTRPLKSLLLESFQPESGVQFGSAIHGLPGVGKSTMAAALAHDAATFS